MSDLARFLFQKGHFSSANQRVKPGGFNPGNRSDLSVFDIRDTDSATRMALGMQVSELQGRDVKARAELALDALDDLPVSFLRDDTPIERHGNITGFPVGVDDDARSTRLELATRLANSSKLVG